jgi:hypothetical protein
MNGAGRWRYSLGWMPIHTVILTSPIIRSRLRQGTKGKRTSTCSSRHLVSDYHVCKSIFQELPPYSNDKTVRWYNFYYKFYSVCEFIISLIYFFVGIHKHFFGVVRVCDVPKQQCRLGVGGVLDISWQHAQRTRGWLWLGADNTLLLVLQPLSIMSRASRLHSRCFSSASDVVVDTIPDQKTEVNQYHSSQLR